MIRGGCPQSDTKCPVGLALQAAGVEPVCVGFNFIACAAEGRVYHLPMPREVSSFLQRHDAAKGVRPTKFRLTFIEEPRRPLPARFRRRTGPKAPPIPRPPAASRPVRLRRVVSRLVGLFSF